MQYENIHISVLNKTFFEYTSKYFSTYLLALHFQIWLYSFWHESLRMLPASMLIHTVDLLFRWLRDRHKSLGCVRFDISSNTFPEYEPYGVVLNYNSVIQRQCLLISQRVAWQICSFSNEFEELSGIVHVLRS